MRLPRVALLCMAFLFLAPALALADLAAAETAYRNGDFEAARTILEAPDLRADPDALMLLAELVRDGKGGVQDPLEAYKLYSLVFMLGEPDPRADAAQQRRWVAREMTTADILAAEVRVIEWVDKEMGAAERKHAVAALKTDLSRCRSRCSDEAVRVFSFGPAAAAAVPELEALMVRDPMWMPRTDYAQALAVIGTASVDALCRLILDEEQVVKDGTWNVSTAAEALRLMGPTAHAARPCLMQALTRPYTTVSDLQTDLTDKLAGGDADAVVFGVKAAIVDAIAEVRDPERTLHGPLVSYLREEKSNPQRLLVVWALGRLYEEFGEAVALVAHLLDTGSITEKSLGLRMLLDLSQIPGFPSHAAALIPQLTQIAASDDPEISGVSRQLLSVIQK